MHRRPIGRGRMIAVAGALVILVAVLLPWFRIGGEAGSLTAEVENGFKDFGILCFFAALAVLGLVTLPYATDRPVAADRGTAYVLLTGLAAIGVAAWPIPFLGDAVAGLLPDRAPGWWLAIIGVVILGRAAFEIVQEPARR